MDARPGMRGEVRTVFVSDVHLGCRHSQVEALLEFLQGVRPASLYLVGDFFDGWKLRHRWRWLPDYSQVLQELGEMAAAGTRLFYTPGNHDAWLREDACLRQFLLQFPWLEVADEFRFTAGDGRRFLVTHGDLFDAVECRANWLSRLSCYPYDALLSLNRLAHRLARRGRGNPYRWCARVKSRVKRGVCFLSRFEQALLEHARRQGCDGAICGHIHTPDLVHRNGLTYCNTGDWVENCTALVEYADGTLELRSAYEGTLAVSAPCRRIAPGRRSQAARGAPSAG